MKDLYKNTYKIESTRLTNWDYSKPGYYFITICTHDRKIFFGKIVDKQMVLNNIGKIVEKLWHELSNHFPNIILDDFIVMPNHLHGIILIQSQEKDFDYFFNGNVPGTYNEPVNDDCRDAIYGVSGNVINCQNRDAMNRVSTGGVTKIYNPMGKKTISEMIRWFKGRSSFEINKNFSPLYFSWQSRFHDHVIRDAESLIAIRGYILNNPYNWANDRNNPLNFN